MANHKLSRQDRWRAFRKAKKKCYWCGVQCVMPESGVDYKGNEPENMATLDHLLDRFDIRRKLDESYVLACHKCNKTRMIQRNCILGDRTAELLYPAFDIRELIEVKNGHVEK